MQNKIIFIFLALIVVLGGCSSKEKPPLKGDRISVLQLQNTLEVDQKAGDIAITIPDAQSNTEWAQNDGNAIHMMQNVALGAAIKKTWSESIGEGSDKERKLITVPIVADGKVFVSNTEGEVRAFDLSNGKALWRVNIIPEDEDDSVAVSAGLAFGNGMLYVTDGVKNVLALNPVDGSKIWSQSLDYPVRGAPGFSNGHLYVVTLGDETIAMDAANGSILWTHKGVQEGAGLLGAPSPAAEGSVVMTCYSSGDIVALRAETGQEAWSDNLAGISELNRRAVTQLSGFHGSPVLDGDHVIVGNNAARTISIHIPSGERKWQKEFGSAQTPWVSGNMVYVLTAQNELVALIKETGQVRWVTPLARFEDPDDKEDPIFWSGPVMAGGRLILAGSNEKMIEIDPQTGKITRSADLPDRVMLPPVVANNTLLILTDDGTLAAYR